MSAEAAAPPVPLHFRVGTRTLGQVRRRLVRLSIPLDQALAGSAPLLPSLPPRADGYLVRAMPAAQLASIAAQSGMRPFVRQTYPRHYAQLDQDFDAYLSGFSSRARSSLKRKRRKLEERSGGQLDVRLYRKPEEIDSFYRHARSVSALTYQERRLDAGLPNGSLEEMRELAARNAMRAWLLFLDGRPIAYLYAPARGESLIYAFLGYDPAASDLSPGTILQLEAMRMLMEERRFRWFDFTEGDGQHKRQFATGAIDSVDLLLLRPSLGNIAVARALAGFDAGVALAKRLAGRTGLRGIARAAGR